MSPANCAEPETKPPIVNVPPNDAFPLESTEKSFPIVILPSAPRTILFVVLFLRFIAPLVICTLDLLAPTSPITTVEPKSATSVPACVIFIPSELTTALLFASFIIEISVVDADMCAFDVTPSVAPPATNLPLIVPPSFIVNPSVSTIICSFDVPPNVNAESVKLTTLTLFLNISILVPSISR